MKTSQQIMIIGLGRFGMALARALSDRGAEVLAVDLKKERVEEAAGFVSHAAALDASNEAQLAQLLPATRHAAVCAIGDEAREDSIMCVALLRQMGCPYIVARANSPIHRRILQMVGAHEIINPQEEFGRRFATRLLLRDIIACTPLNEDLELSEIRLPMKMVGKSLIELALPRRYGIIVAAVRRDGELLRPDPAVPLEARDRLLIVAGEKAIARLDKEA